jgi:hypothetical protein
MPKLVSIYQYNTDIPNTIFGLERQAQHTEEFKKLKIFLGKHKISTGIQYFTKHIKAAAAAATATAAAAAAATATTTTTTTTMA